MQDPRYTLLLIPLIYVLIPYFLTGSFIILGGVTVIAFISAALIFIVITNVNFGGALQVIIGTGGGANIGMNNEGGYSLFVVFVGGIFYLGAQLATFFTPILNVLLYIINAIIGFIGWLTGVNTSTLQTSLISGVGSLVSPNLNQVYPILDNRFNILGINVFFALDVIMGSLFILGLYFMIANRGH